jgi:hypothetical protein
MLTPRERIRIAMGRGAPDRVPVWCQLSLEHIIRNGTPDGEYPKTIEDYVRAECGLALRYGFDGSLLTLPAMREGARVDSFLRELIHPKRPEPADRDFSTADPEAWERPRTELAPEDFHSSRFAREVVGPDRHLGGWIGDAFSFAVHWFPSIGDAMMALAEDPQRFLALVSYYEEACIESARAQIRLGGMESISISSPYAGSSLISTQSYEELVLPQLTRIAAALRPEPAFTYVHTCGFLSDRLELVASSGVDGIECMDPPPLGNVELGEAKRRVGGSVFLKGNLDSVNVLLKGTDEQVDRAIMHCLAAGMPGGGYILSTACSVAPGVPPNRVRRLAELAAEFGRYDGA